jgi:gliding motility-associated-like protein
MYVVNAYFAIMVRTFSALTACSLLLTVSAQRSVPRFPFSQNKGQWPKQVLYRTLTGQGALFVERDALTYVLRSGGHSHGNAKSDPSEERREHAYRMRFIGGNAGSCEGLERLPYYENYFIGGASNWAGHVPVHGAVRLKGLYPGIDLVLHGQEQLEYDLLLAPGAKAGDIRMRYEGQDGIGLRDGRLVIVTSVGEVREEAPMAWQDIDGERTPVACRFALDGDVARFDFPDGYDTRHALTIDPVLSFSTFTGSTADNFGFTATYDESGHLYGGGIVFGVGYPVTVGVQQPTFAGNTIDIGLSKFSPDGTQLIWSTYLGGLAGNESPHSLVVNSQDELFLMGITGSSDFPTTTGCFDNSFGAGPPTVFTVGEGYNHDNGTDIFVSHLSADASQLLGSTFVGGSNSDGLNNSTVTAWNYGDPFRGEIVLDSQERPVVASCTMSSDIPVSPNAPFNGYQGGEQDGYVFAMDPGLTTELWATFYGGALTDACYSLQLDANDEVFVTGGTNSPDLDMAGTPFIATAQGGVDGFVARFSPTGDALLSATYLGTPAYDQGYFVQLDTDGAVFIVGQTHGTYPVTPGKYANPNSSQFIQKLDHQLSASQWSTVIGNGQGNEDISPAAFLVSDCGQIFFSGWGGSVNHFQQALSSTTFGMPTTPDALQTTTDGSDFYLMVLEAEASDIYYATFFGGSVSTEHVDGGTSRFSKTGVVYQAVCAGCGGNSDMTTTPGAWSSTNNSFNCNLGVFKMDFEVAVSATFTATPFFGCTGDTIHFISTGTATDWQWEFGDNTPGSTLEDPDHVYTAAGTYPVTLIALDTNACNLTDTLTLDIEIQSPTSPTPGFSVEQGPCGDLTVTVTNATPGFGQTYVWDMGDDNTYNSEDVTHTYAATGTYTITLTATDTLCGGAASFSQEVTLSEPADVEALFATSSADLCSGLTITGVSESTGPTGLQLTWDMGDGTLLTGSSVSHLYEDEGTYTITLTAFDPECLGSDTYSTEVTVVPGTAGPEEFIVPNVFSPNGDGKNEVFFPIPQVSGSYVSLKVFNRWGMKLYETGSNFKPWSGKAGPGDPVPEGVYFYILDYRIPCLGETLQGEKKGVVQLLR